MRLPGYRDRQAGRRAGAVVVTAPLGKWSAPAGLVRRIKGALVRRQLVKAVANAPALVVGLAVGIIIGVALVAVLAAAREGSTQ